VFGFTSLYVTAFHNPRPHGVQIGIVGSKPAVAQASSAINRAMPGGFRLERYAAEPDARAALANPDVHGVLVIGSRSDTALVAGAFGFAPTEAVTAAAGAVSEGTGRSLAVHDVNPLPQRDSRGLSSFFTVFGTLVPSLVFGALLTLLGGRLPARIRWPVTVLFALCAGLVAAVSVGAVVGALHGHFWAVAGVAALLALAVAAIVHGLGRVAGALGIAGAAVVLILLGQSSSGGALTFELEPSFYGAVSQLLPQGAAISALRNSVYFHGAHTLVPLLVLAVWAVVGVVLGLAGDAIKSVVPGQRARAGENTTASPTPAAT
jgi:hypothetical protein